MLIFLNIFGLVERPRFRLPLASSRVLPAELQKGIKNTSMSGFIYTSLTFVSRSSEEAEKLVLDKVERLSSLASTLIAEA